MFPCRFDVCLAAAVLIGTPHAQAVTQQLVLSGNVIPTTEGGAFSSFTAPAISHGGLAIFNARLTDTPADADSGIFHKSVIIPGVPASNAVDTVAREGQTAPPASGNPPQYADLFVNSASYISRFDQEVVFNANLSDTGVQTNSGLYARLPASATANLLVREDDLVPDGNGRFGQFNALSLFGVSDTGVVGFFSALRDTNNSDDDDTGIYRVSAITDVTQVIREGQALDGGIVDQVYSPEMGGTGGIVFGVDLTNTITNNDGGRIVKSAPGSPIVVARQGETTPNGDGEYVNFFELLINGSNDVAFVATLSGTDTNGTGNSTHDDTGVFAQIGGTLVELVREGDVAPDGNGEFDNFFSPFAADVSIRQNNAGAVAFAGVLRETTGPGDDDAGIFIADSDGVVQVARQGDPVPEGGGTFVSFSDPAINDHGQVAFVAKVDTGEVIDEGEGPVPVIETALYLGDEDELVLMARQGQPLGGGQLRDIHFETTDARSGFNNHGTAVILADLINGLSGRGIFAVTPDIGWRAAGGGMWDDASNWFFDMIPSQPHMAVIDPDIDAVIQGPTSNQSIGQLVVGGSDGNVTLVLGNGLLTVTGGTTIHDNGGITGSGMFTGPIDNTGQVTVLDGQMLVVDGDFTNNGVVHIGDDGQLVFVQHYMGNGQIEGSGKAVFQSLVDPGNSVGSLAMAGDAVFEASSTILFEIGGLVRGQQYDAIDVDGIAELAGSVEITLIDGHTLAADQIYILLLAGSITGDVTGMVLPNVPDLHLALRSNATGLWLEVSNIPEPTTAAVLLCFGLVYGLRRPAHRRYA